MKVIIVGALSKQRNFPNKELPENVEVWGINAIRPAWVPKWHRMFNLHTYANLQRYRWPHLGKEWTFSSENPSVPFYTIDEWPDPHKLAGWQEFPGRRIMSTMPRGSYHVTSFDWMVAFAICLTKYGWEQGFAVEAIEFHGTQLNMEAGEPISARACLEYWCGRAEGEGIKISLADDAKLFDFYHLVRSNLTYGYDDTPVVENATAPEIAERLAAKPVPYDYDR